MTESPCIVVKGSYFFETEEVVSYFLCLKYELYRALLQADVWAIGVIAYTCLAGYPPFFAERGEPDTDDTVLRKIVNGQWEFHDRTWSAISDEVSAHPHESMCTRHT